MKSVNHKKRNKVIILLVILVVLLGTYFGVVKYNKIQEGKEEADEEITVTSIDTDEVTGLTYTSGGTEYSFVKTEDEWKYEQDTSLPINQTSIDNIVSNACALKAERLLVDNLDDVASYGLDNPAYTVKLTVSEGTETIIYIGNQNTATSVYYAYTSDGENIYTIDQSLVSTLGYTLNELITLETIPSMTSSNITDMDFSDTDTSLDFDYFGDGNAEYDYSASLVWFLNSGGATVAADATAISTLQTNISSLAFDTLIKYHATEEDLNIYGLTTPRASLTVKYTTTYEETSEETTEDSTEETTTETITVENTFKLNIGNQDESGNYYVKAEGMNGIYTMSSDTIEYFLDLTKPDFANKSAFNVLKDSIDSINISTGGNSWDIVLNRETTTDDSGNEETEYSYTVNGAELDSDKFDALYSQLQNLTAESAVEKGSADEGDEYMSIVFNRNTDYFKTVSIKLSTYNASFYQANLEGSDTLLLNMQDISALVSSLEALNN